MLRFAWWKNFIVATLLTLFLTMPAWGDGMPDSGGAGFTDYGSFLGEYQAAGAFKFYDNTEALLRMAQFELSLMRYRFLKGQIQRKVDYRGLVQMVDLRLRFLKKQMHLTNTDIAAIPPRKVRIPKAKKPETNPAAGKPDAAKPTPPGAADKNKAKAAPSMPGASPTVVVIPPPGKAAATLPGTPPVKSPGTLPGTPPGATSAGPPAAPSGTPQAAPPGTPQAMPPAATEKPPDVVVTDTPTTKEDGKTEEEKEKVVKPPPPPPGFWERLKIRLHLKKKAAEAS